MKDKTFAVMVLCCGLMTGIISYFSDDIIISFMSLSTTIVCIIIGIGYLGIEKNAKKYMR